MAPYASHFSFFRLCIAEDVGIRIGEESQSAEHNYSSRLKITLFIHAFKDLFP